MVFENQKFQIIMNEDLSIICHLPDIIFTKVL